MPALGAAAALLATPAAGIADTPGLTATLPPYDYAGFQSHLILDDVGQAGGLTPNQVPNSLAIDLAQGFGIDPLAVSTLCTTAQANNNACPSASRIGRGTIDVTLSGLLSGNDTATIDLYEMAPQASGDIAGAAFHFFINDTKNQFQFQGTSIGHIRPISGDPTFGATIAFDKLPVPQVPPGINVTLNDLKADIGAPDLAASAFLRSSTTGTTTHKRRHHRKRRHHKKRRHHRHKRAHHAQTSLTPKPLAHSLLTNPASCGGSWPVRVIWGYSSGAKTADAAAPCAAAP